MHLPCWCKLGKGCSTSVLVGGSLAHRWRQDRWVQAPPPPFSPSCDTRTLQVNYCVLIPWTHTSRTENAVEHYHSMLCNFSWIPARANVEDQLLQPQRCWVQYTNCWTTDWPTGGVWQQCCCWQPNLCLVHQAKPTACLLWLSWLDTLTARANFKEFGVATEDRENPSRSKATGELWAFLGRSWSVSTRKKHTISR